MDTVALSLGTNQGDRILLMQQMRVRVCALLQPPIVVSDILETEPVGEGHFSTWFLNCVVTGQYSDTAEILHAHCRDIEIELGRMRKNGITDRTADIDILLFGDNIISHSSLTVPHPQILNRRFILEGLRQVAPRLRHPVTGLTFEQLFDEMKSEVRKQNVHSIKLK